MNEDVRVRIDISVGAGSRAGAVIGESAEARVRNLGEVRHNSGPPRGGKSTEPRSVPRRRACVCGEVVLSRRRHRLSSRDGGVERGLAGSRAADEGGTAGERRSGRPGEEVLRGETALDANTVRAGKACTDGGDFARVIDDLEFGERLDLVSTGSREGQVVGLAN